MVEPTPLKNMLVKLGHLPRVRGENKKYLKPPSSFVACLGDGFGWLLVFLGSWSTVDSALGRKILRMFSAHSIIKTWAQRSKRHSKQLEGKVGTRDSHSFGKFFPGTFREG